MLEGVNVALGVTGSIAAVRTVELAHELRRRGAEVRAVCTHASTGIVNPWALEFATGRDPVTEITGAVEHVELCGRDGWADVLLIAPATANTIGKMAATIDDSPVTTCATTALGADVPVVVAPAMHEPMYDHPGVPQAIGTLESWGVAFVDPRIEEGKAKIATEDAIALATARAAFTDADEDTLRGESIVVTAGATAERVDPVRVLTNRSSGKMGRAVARACYVRGANVTVVHGPVGPRPFSNSGANPKADDTGVPYARLVEVDDSEAMLEALEDAIADADALVAAAAVGDYTTPKHADKLRSGESRSLDLEPTPKLIDGAREAEPSLPIVGFKTETSGDDDAMVAAARAIMERADLDLVVANDASVMGADETRALFVDSVEDVDGSPVSSVSGSKAAVGERIADRVAALLA
ncbi:phosphopantothenoylcysteine decarboxylase/phosphopantothenate/cysteine ligase [Salinarchaeum sp. Harcht-Bsk1]|uniref:bifunctional phosphopantothenoylcysteine decarboxylase/phosphopantothenate--cysteine ligase CoaBC n=1 Tax=Salinarchaeum sp. Harcht-Bsk1 TaxID=1333523 RepID=UPI00034239FE|nr:bifunctional phosphopantothenoylcysteine decarboxylase/phosphopantothenate--cysteine ligase CoaBC [Salinarchaeum sp. Harcht-Bsk1]AGN00100.1 phosphopantothenoylcysteine decarboxylase/phosphopantothenate/cysteine ligase [Salinarchaeum sp. Harcht-Bsk1]